MGKLTGLNSFEQAIAIESAAEAYNNRGFTVWKLDSDKFVDSQLILPKQSARLFSYG
ncbi:hypothetical protein [Chlorogloeopsis sp. ULAP02]|uniref:hypothetical protein n=1 Tax=Chlorogloeopsis sp. ULAP02 TaxID=3107926 RepID=UPI003137225F